MEMDQKRSTRISNCLKRRRELKSQPFESFGDSIRAGLGFGLNLGGIELFPTEEEYTALREVADRIRRREQSENTAKLRDLGVEITETEEPINGQA